MKGEHRMKQRDAFFSFILVRQKGVNITSEFDTTVPFARCSLLFFFCVPLSMQNSEKSYEQNIFRIQILTTHEYCIVCCHKREVRTDNSLILLYCYIGIYVYV